MILRFVDTAHYLAILNPRDEHHAAAVRAQSLEGYSYVTTDGVILELANAVAHSSWRVHATALIRMLRNSPTTQILPLTAVLMNEGLDLYEKRPDKAWSLTDCISFAVMEQRGIREALTTDRHFQQAGFRALLAE